MDNLEAFVTPSGGRILLPTLDTPPREPLDEIVAKRLAFCKQNLVSEEELWNDLNRGVLDLIKSILEKSLKIELFEHVGTEWYKRSKERKDYRNGRYSRKGFKTKFGYIKQLEIPRARNRPFRSQIIRRYKRKEKTVDKLIMDIFLNGISTRKVGDVLEPILERKISANVVSEVTKELGKEVEKFHKRPLEDKYIYLIFDAVNLNIRTYQVEKRPVLCAYGITMDGNREMIDYKQAKCESWSEWSTFIYDLYERGLEGKNTKLIIRDGKTSLKNALEDVYPGIPQQVCWVHKIRNVETKVPKRVIKRCLGGLKRVYTASSRHQAYKEFKVWKEEWEASYPRAVKCVENNLEELLNFYNCPKEHWKKVRTTNVIERCFREVRKRARLVNVFSNRESCERIIYAVFRNLNEKWKESPLKEFKFEKGELL